MQPSNWIISPGIRDENQKYWKPPPWGTNMNPHQKFFCPEKLPIEIWMAVEVCWSRKTRRKSSQPAFCKSWLFNTFVRLKDMYESSMSWSNQKNLVPARLPMCILTFLFRDGVFNISPFVDGIHNPLECVKYVSYWFTYLFNYSIYLPIYQ